MGPTELPIVGKIAAGKPIEAQEHIETVDLAALLAQPDCFVLRIDGDSMIDRGIRSGDLAIIRPANTVRDGDIVVALIDGEATLKEFQRIDGGRRVKLVPYNKKMTAKTYPAEEVVVQGILASIVRTQP